MWSTDWKLSFSTKNCQNWSQSHISIFGSKIESSLFWHQNYQKLTLEATNRFLVKKSKVHFFDQKWRKMHPREITKLLFVKRLKVQFFDQKLPKMDPRGYISIFENRKPTFSTKNCQNWPWRPQIDFWSKNWKFNFSTKND